MRLFDFDYNITGSYESLAPEMDALTLVIGDILEDGSELHEYVSAYHVRTVVVKNEQVNIPWDFHRILEELVMNKIEFRFEAHEGIHEETVLRLVNNQIDVRIRCNTYVAETEGGN